VLEDAEAFRSAVMDGMPTPPPYYPTTKAVNKVGAALLRDLPSGRALSPADAARAQERGGLVIDARSPEAFAQAHIPGALFAGDDADLVAWVGWFAPYDRDLVIVLEDEARFDDVQTALRRIGLDRVAGYLDGGVPAWEASGRAVNATPTISVEELHRRLIAPDGLVALDVRSGDEWVSGHIAGAVHRFVGDLATGADAPGDPAGELAVICASGRRSTVAISLLEARGRRHLINVRGGVDAWRSAGLPLVA
jgi:rhodanese-related sulfurtransferase